jgi:hypothetical protein
MKVGEWWVILRLEKFMSAQLDAPTRQRLLNELFQKWLLEQMQERARIYPQPALAPVSS